MAQSLKTMYIKRVKGTPTMMTFIQQHPNAPHFGYTVSFTPMGGDKVLVITDTDQHSLTLQDARAEWRQNAAQGWERLF